MKRSTYRLAVAEGRRKTVSRINAKLTAQRTSQERETWRKLNYSLHVVIRAIDRATSRLSELSESFGVLARVMGERIAAAFEEVTRLASAYNQSKWSETPIYAQETKADE